MKGLYGMKFNHIELNNELMIKDENGAFSLHKDKEALEVFLKEVDSKTRKFTSEIKRMEYLIEKNYYVDFFEEMYTKEQAIEFLEKAYSYDFEFKSYMAATKFYRDYALKSNDKKYYLENYEQRCVVVAMYLAEGNIELAENIIDGLMTQRIQPATPTFLNSGKKRSGELVSCFLLEMDDNLNSINYNFNVSTQLSKVGGGVAINLSKLRARGESIKKVKGVAKGVIPVAKILEMGFNYADQLGQRPGAGAVYLNIFHLDILDFLDAKKVNADESIRLATISTGITVPSFFFKLAKENIPMYIFGPNSIYDEYGLVLDEIDIEKYYDDFVHNKNVIKKEINARELLTKIAQTQLQSGYPYLVFTDNANKVHALKDIGKIKISNLCTEIFQLQETSTIDGYNSSKNIIKRDISCNLSSLNIVNVMEQKKIKESVYQAVELLTQVSLKSNIKQAPGVIKANEELHSIGLGAMNLHGFLAKNQIQYESDEARDFANTFFMMVNYYSLKKSNMIAQKTGTTFKDFNKSEYASGVYFDKYVQNDYSPKYEKIKSLFDGIKIPTKENWERLKIRVMDSGLYHAYRLAVAPTQSISYVQNSTPSVLPIVDQIERRAYGNAETFYPMPFFNNKTMWFYKSAFNMNQERIIDMISTIQEHVDQGISTILYVKSDITTRQLVRYYLYAHARGLKSLYYTRNKLLSVSECTSCSI